MLVSLMIVLAIVLLAIREYVKNSNDSDDYMVEYE